MIIDERVYGKIEIKEPVLLELMNSRPLQRLKGINQAGATAYALPGKDITRFEHCVGVMILLRILGASVEEQIAGLLHDVPHTAFSHVADLVFPSHNHEFHEKFHEEIIMKSEIPEILRKYNFDLERILDDSNFSLLENDIPDLCADRVDYTLRDMSAYDVSEKVGEKYLSNFVAKDNEIIIKDKIIARDFAEDYLHTDKTRWSSPLEVGLFQILADAVRIGLDEEIISQDDLFEDDDFVYNKLESSGNFDILEKLKMLNPNIEIVEDGDNYDFHSRNKIRFVDPKFLDEGGELKRVSEEFVEFKEKLEDYKKGVGVGMYIRVVSY